MKGGYTCASVDYLGKHKIYCFKRSFSDINPLSAGVVKYEEGDFLPLISNNYIYGSNVLILDFNNKVVHIIEDYIYKKSLKIGASFDVSVCSYFEKRKYLSIDVYGRVLSISNIFDLYKCINSYPEVEICLEERRNSKKNSFKENADKEYLTIINNTNQYKKNGILLSGYIVNCSKDKIYQEGVSFDVAKEINEEILGPLMESFEDEFIDIYDVNYSANRLLEIFDLLYSLIESRNGKIIKYLSYGKIKVTHIDKLKREIKQIIELTEEAELDEIMDIVFMAISGEYYIDFIVETISTLLDIND